MAEPDAVAGVGPPRLTSASGGARGQSGSSTPSRRSSPRCPDRLEEGLDVGKILILADDRLVVVRVSDRPVLGRNPVRGSGRQCLFGMSRNR
jgi:hypothetical protein